ncbi:hypothetical protein HPB47_016324 [Ixodes persulcatus]|uniref:Uncharacterized protein n=2 Tax=Ixodes persulcatus TaxID=34615 RepID=A0AC60QQB4_IXOPE|nr:hypothetical protein HPB47_017047 [Ixodes persulcatus]KAG0440338.1 hypothetical protein HPB47_016324 [Ixodes persulcatus]
MGIKNFWNTFNAVCNRAVEEELGELLKRCYDADSAVETVRRCYFAPMESTRGDYYREDRHFTYDPALRIQVVVDGNIFLHHCKYALTDHHLTQFRQRIREVRSIADEETRASEWKKLNVEIARRYVQIYRGDLVSDFVEEYRGDDGLPDSETTSGGKRARGEDECEELGPNERCVRYDAFFATVFHCITKTVKKTVCGLSLKSRMDVDVVVVFDGISPTIKWGEQYYRRHAEIETAIRNDNDADSVGSPAKRARLARNARLQAVLNERLPSLARCGKATMSTTCKLTAASDAMQHVSGFFQLLHDEEYAKVVIDGYDKTHDRAYQMTSLTLLPPVYVGEGDVKVLDAVLCPPTSNGTWDASVIVTDDSDVMLGAASIVEEIPSKDVYVYSARQYTESRKRRDEYVFELPHGGGEARVSLVDDCEYPSRQRGYYHVKDDFYARFFRAKPFDCNPLSFAVPLLLYGGYEMMPLLISSSKKPEPKAVAAFRAMTDAAKEERTFYSILLAATTALVPYETHATNTRTRAQAKAWPDPERRRVEVEEAVVKYVRTLQYTVLYATHRAELAWYLPPDLRETLSSNQNRAAQVSVADVAAVVERLYDDGEFESRVDLRPYLLDGVRLDHHRGSILADYERNDGDVLATTKALYALYMLGALEANGDWWRDSEAVAAAYRWYEINCLCSCTESTSTRSLRNDLTVYQRPVDEVSRAFTTKLIRSSYKKNRTRLGNVELPDFTKLYREMSS